MEYRKLNDEALLRLIARAQEPALGELYDRYNRLVYSLAVNAVGDSALAEEITQDVFMRIWEKAETYRPEQGKVFTWLTRIARNRSIDMIRRRTIRPEGNRASWAEEGPLDLPDPTDVEMQVHLSQQKNKVRAAVAGLPAEQRLVLAYAFFQGYSHSEIAALVNEPLGTVKTRIRLAMQKLRQALSEENPHHA